MSIRWHGLVAFLGRRNLGTKMGNMFVSRRKYEDGHVWTKNGWGISEDLLNQLDRDGVEYIHLIVTDRHQTLEASVQDWQTHGEPWHIRPYEPQLVLHDSFFREVD